MHSEKSPLAWQTISVDIGRGSVEQYEVEDWWDHLAGNSPYAMEFLGNWACKNYIARVAARGLPQDDEVLYGKIGGLGHLVHLSEIVKG
jgi:hypothetical protein